MTQIAPCACCGRVVYASMEEYFLHNIVCDAESCQAWKREQDERMNAALARCEAERQSSSQS